MITNIYNKQTKVPTVMELFIVTGKLKKFLWQVAMFDVCTTGDTAHIDTIFKSPVVHTLNISNCHKNFFSFPVAVNNSITVSPLVFLL
jgi:hypothetical protein